MIGIGVGISSMAMAAALMSNVAPELAPLTLSATTIAENSAPGTFVAAVLGATAGSTLSLVGDAGGRFALSGSTIVAGLVATDFETATSHQITVRETLAGAINSPRDTVLTITVTNVFEQPNLTALTLSSSAAQAGTAAAINIIGATAGSVITGTVPDGMVLNSAARTITGTPTTAGTYNFALTETLGDSANSPRQSNVTITVAAPASVFAGAAAAFSVRIPAGSVYNGPLIRVRRSSDNAEADIGAVAVADANGNRWLDEAALLLFANGANAILAASDFTNAAWTKSSVTAGSTRLTATNTSSPGVTQTRSVTAGTYVFSVDVMTAGTTTPWLRMAWFIGGDNAEAFFNSQTGAIGTVSVSHFASARPIPGGWRFSVTRTVGAGSLLLAIRLVRENASQNGVIGHTLTATTSYLQAAGSAFVAIWYDQSGNGRHATQSDPARQPRIVNLGARDLLNGRPSPRGVAHNALVAPAPMANTAELTVSVVMQPSSFTAQGGFGVTPWGLAGGSQRIQAHMPWIDGIVYFDLGGTGAPLRVQGPLGLPANTPFIGTFRGSVSQSLQSVHINGTQIAADTSGNSAPVTTLTLFRNAGGTDETPRGPCPEFVFFPASLSDDARLALERSQGQAFGITVA